MQISVIIPAYNSAATIGAALDSVAAQDGEDLEIIVVNDCSGDDTVVVARAWDARRNPARVPLQLMQTPRNSGPAGARNLGIQNAQGDWIAFLDADDEWLPGKIETQVAHIRKFSRENDGTLPYLVCGATLPLSLEKQPRRPTSPASPTSLTSPTRPTLAPEIRVRRLLLEDFTIGNPVATSTVLIRRDVLKAVGGFDEQFRGPEDYDLWMRVAAADCRLQTTDGRLQTADRRRQTADCRLQTADRRLQTEAGRGEMERLAVLLKLEAPLTLYRERHGTLSMNDRLFLSQVLKVLDKAYGPNGALAGLGGKRKARAYQYLCAAWSAAARGARMRAIGLLMQSFSELPLPLRLRNRPSWARLKVLAFILKAH